MTKSKGADKENVMLAVRIPPALHDRARHFAIDTRSNLRGITLAALQEYLDRHAPQAATVGEPEPKPRRRKK
jgi:predicted transcriptional regulator